MEHRRNTDVPSEEELTRLALKYPPPDDAPSEGDVASSKRRARPFLIIFFCLMSALFIPMFAAELRTLRAHGDSLICRVSGCRPRSVAVVYLGVAGSLSIVGLIASFARRP